jgi:hypothetical protein
MTEFKELQKEILGVRKMKNILNDFGMKLAKKCMVEGNWNINMEEFVNEYLKINQKITKKMSVNELCNEYEEMLNIELTERDKAIFRYAYFVGKGNLDIKE